jgi:peptide chain release factor 1
MADILERTLEAEKRASELESQLADPALAGQPGQYEKLGRELGALRPLVELGARLRKARAELEDATAMSQDADPELAELARAEAQGLREEIAEIERQLGVLLVPRDPSDEKNAILEIRAGTGGEEAALFAGELFRMYSRYAERRGWKVEALSTSETGSGGLKEVIASVTGDGVFSRLKYERGVHRVQRVPETESQGRIHTSTVTVAVMPEAEEIDVQIDPGDLRIDVMRAGGPGGQSVNTTDSAVRITHLPTGMVVQCQDEKSQHKNKARALKVLRSRLLDMERERADRERADARRAQVGTGERSEKIRTYNFPQNRVTDHRAGITVHKLESILEGDLEELTDAVAAELAARAEAGT